MYRTDILPRCVFVCFCIVFHNGVVSSADGDCTYVSMNNETRQNVYGLLELECAWHIPLGVVLMPTCRTELL